MPTDPEGPPADDRTEQPPPADSPDPADSAAGEANPYGWDPSGLDLARAVAAQFSVEPGRNLEGHAAGAEGSRPGRGGRAGRGRHRRTGNSSRSGSGPDDRDPQLLDRTIERLVADHGWSAEVAVAGAISRWDQIVGAEVASHCTAEGYTDAELTVRADSTAWATQVRLLAPTLVKRLNEELGDGTVRKVTVVGPSAPSWRRGRRAVRDGRGPRDTYG